VIADHKYPAGPHTNLLHAQQGICINRSFVSVRLTKWILERDLVYDDMMRWVVSKVLDQTFGVFRNYLHMAVSADWRFIKQYLNIVHRYRYDQLHKTTVKDAGQLRNYGMKAAQISDYEERLKIMTSNAEDDAAQGLVIAEGQGQAYEEAMRMLGGLVCQYEGW
jgi:hypothetical protein